MHDEAYAYLPEVAEAFYRVRRILFISEGEQELAYRLFGGTIAAKSFLVGAGVELNDAGSTNGSKTATGRFLLYLGRKDEGKNVPLLLNAFHRFRSVRPNSDLKLVLAGHGKVPDPATNGSAVDLGLVSESKKRELLASCTALVQPSENESFSRVMMEAWLCARPVAGHTRCPATSVAIHHAGGGWLAETEDDWARLFVEIDRTGDETLGQFGVRGRAYARKMADWALVVQRYEEALNGDSPKSIRSNAATQSPVPAINQFLPNLAYGDAISRKAVWIRDELRQAGFDSNIFVQFVDPRVAHECAVFSLRALEDSDALIYHHSIGAEMTPHLMKFPGPKYLIYHNITPGEFFEAYRPNFAQRLYRGRQELAQLARHFPHSAGASAFNARELARSGFNEPGVLPLAIDPGKWALAPDPGVMEQMQDGRTNILFVGRFAPNKKQDDLLTAFAHYLHHDPDARLILVGKPEEEDPYVVHVQNVLRALRLERSVVVPGSIDDAQLAAYYRTAHLFWSMSEHEGFCVPLIEAMWFDLPILAFKAAAVPETLAEAGLMFTSKENWPQLAAIARLIVTDPGLREKLIAAQRTRRLQFLPARVRPILMKMAATLIPHQVTAGEAAWTDNA
ncbi:MAG: glycosyltransferase family 4 protein [Chthoniobacterales bacterium]